MQSKKDGPTFNIRKVPRRGGKHPQQFALFSPECEFEKYPEAPTFTNPKREKELMIDYSVNEAVLNSKAYTDLLHNYNESKRRTSEKKRELEEEIARLKQQKQQAMEQERRVELERRKYQQLLANLKERIVEIREKNREAKAMLQNRMNNQADYLTNLLISMRFQAQYQHDIDPDQMTYEELLELEEKIGSVSRGLPAELLENFPREILGQNLEDQCTICICPMETGETISKLSPCGHIFHLDCVRNWLAKQKVCSLCKQEIVIPK